MVPNIPNHSTIQKKEKEVNPLAECERLFGEIENFADRISLDTRKSTLDVIDNRFRDIQKILRVYRADKLLENKSEQGAAAQAIHNEIDQLLRRIPSIKDAELQAAVKSLKKEFEKLVINESLKKR